MEILARTVFLSAKTAILKLTVKNVQLDSKKSVFHLEAKKSFIVNKFVEMEEDSSKLVMMETRRKVMDVVIHAKLNQDGLALVEHLLEKIHALNSFLIELFLRAEVLSI